MNNDQVSKDNTKKVDHEGIRRGIVQTYRDPHPNEKHITKAAKQINDKIKHFNSSSKGRGIKNMPEEKQTLNTIKEVSSKLLVRAAKSALDKSENIRQSANQKVKDMYNMTDKDTNTIFKGKEKEANRLSKEVNADREMSDKKAKQARFFARAAARRAVKEEAVDEGLGKTLAAGALALGIGAGVGAATTKAFPDKPLHYQVKKIGDKYNVYHKNNVGGKIHFSSDSESKAKDWMKQNEELELDEAKRGRPPKVGSKAFLAAKSKAQSGEGEEQEADKNIINQMRKKPVADHHTLTFNNGEKKQVHVQHVNKALSMFANTTKPADKEKLQNSLSHSHDRFMATIKSGKPVEDAARPKVSLGKMKAESVDPETASADRKAKKPFLRRDSEGVLRVHSRTGGPTSRDVVDAQEAITIYDPKKDEQEEKKEKHEKHKGFSIDLTSDSRKKMAADPLASSEKIDLPPTLGNVSAGGEDTTYGMGKFSVAENKTLNNLYVDLSEENRQVFNNLILTDEGREKLLQFARNQGY